MAAGAQGSQDPLIKVLTDMSFAIRNIYGHLAALHPPPPPPQGSMPPGFPYGLPGYGSSTMGTGSIPIHMLSMPHSLSPLPVFTMASSQLIVLLPLAYGAHVGHSGSSDGSLPYGEVASHGGVPHPLRYYKLDFLTYDGAVDLLNWLNQCEQFFRG
jgi:hypothetical protein